MLEEVIFFVKLKKEKFKQPPQFFSAPPTLEKYQQIRFHPVLKKIPRLI